MAVLFENATADGDYYEVDFEGIVMGVLQLEGTWDGATVTIKGKIGICTEFSEVPDAAGQFTQDTLIGMFFSPGTIRATISGAGASTNLNGCIQPS